MHSGYLTTDWIIPSLLWIILIPNNLQMILIYRDFSVDAYSLLTSTEIMDKGNIYKRQINSHDDFNYAATIHANNAPTIPQYPLRYSITENQPMELRISKIDDDLMKIPEIPSELLKLLQSSSSSNKPMLYYRLREPSNYFHVNETTSELTTKTLLDLEALCPRYCKDDVFDALLTIYVDILTRNFQLICVVNIEITVTDLDDNSPIFPPTVPRPYVLKLKEVIYRAGKHVDLPSAVDKDVQPNNAKLVYRLDSLPGDESDALDTFLLVVRNDTRLALVLQKDLDYESVRQYRFFLVCSSVHIKSDNNNNSHSVSTEDRLEIIVEVLDINDIEPTFAKSVYEIQVREDVPVNSTIYQLLATDNDVNSTITYSLENRADSNVTSKFKVETNGRVTLADRLDYEQSSSYSFTVRASDGEFYALARLIIEVIDVNDEPPEYVLNPHRLTIQENKPARTLIGQLLIIDRDSPEINGQVQCEEPSDVETKQPILFVRESTYITEKFFPSLASSQFDDSDHLKTSPLHSSSETHVYQRYTLYSQAEYDRENGTDEYHSILYCWDGVSAASSSTKSVPKNIFTSDQTSSIESFGSFSASPLSLTGLTATMTITLYVADENDNAPIFDKQQYEAEIIENAPTNTKIIQVHATDKDVGENAQIHYSLEKNELITPYFKIDPVTGWIMSSAEIDREAQSEFQLTVLAIDGGGSHALDSRSHRTKDVIANYHTATAQLRIRILDENDNAPEFRGPRQFAVEENQPPHTWIGDLQILDRDEGLNSEVTFKILPGRTSSTGNEQNSKKINNNLTLEYDLPFYLLNNGSLFTSEILDRENQSHHCFEVVVSDTGGNKSYSTVDTICIRVLDTNDNKPYFIEIKGVDQAIITKESTANNLSYSKSSSIIQPGLFNQSFIQSETLQNSVVHLSVNEAPGYCVLIAKAVDNDEGINAQLRYSIEQYYSNISQEETTKVREILNAFTMDPKDGQLTLTRYLRWYEIGSYEIILSVEDNGKPVQRAEKVIQLIIEETPARGNLLLPPGITTMYGSKLYKSKYKISEARTILIVIILSGLSVCLAVVIISTILCIVKPCLKSKSSFHLKRTKKNKPSDRCKHYTKRLNTKTFNHNSTKLTSVTREIGCNEDYEHHRNRSSECNSRGSEGILFDPLSSTTLTRHQAHLQNDGLLITNKPLSNPNYSLEPCKLVGIDNCFTGTIIQNRNNSPTTFNMSSSCTSGLSSMEQELCMINGTRAVCVGRVITPVDSIQNVTPQQNCNPVYLEYPCNNYPSTVLSAFPYTIPSRCSACSPHQLDTFNPSFQASQPTFAMPILVTSNNPPIKSDSLTFQCQEATNLPTCYHHHDGSVFVSSNPLTNASVVFDLSTNSFIDMKVLNQTNRLNEVTDASSHPPIISGEEQRSDSGRGASDEENSSQIPITNDEIISSSVINPGVCEQKKFIMLECQVNSNTEIHSNTVNV
ncbi:unnamed protein product [Trichobilharzia szidati]|nr:unnamed protein product [Trichobilharzia szidati]